MSEYVDRNRATYDKIGARFFEKTHDRSAIGFLSAGPVDRSEFQRGAFSDCGSP